MFTFKLYVCPLRPIGIIQRGLSSGRRLPRSPSRSVPNAGETPLSVNVLSAVLIWRPSERLKVRSEYSIAESTSMPLSFIACSTSTSMFSLKAILLIWRCISTSLKYLPYSGSLPSLSKLRPMPTSSASILPSAPTSAMRLIDAPFKCSILLRSMPVTS